MDVVNEPFEIHHR